MFRIVVAGCWFALVAAHPCSGQAKPEGQPATTGAESSSTVGQSPANPLSEALAAYRQGLFPAAIEKFQRVLAANPKSPDAFAGIARSYLKEKNHDMAWDTVSKGLAVNDCPRIRTAMGEVYFRQGKIHEAEREWVQVVNAGHPEARAYLGLSRVRRAIAMYKQAKAMIDKAHELDPNDPEITREWAETLRRPERIKYLEAYLAGPANGDAEERDDTKIYLDSLKAFGQEPGRKCRLVNKLSSTETNLVRLMMDPIHLRGYGLTVIVNGRKTNLMLDTGAGGILVDRGIAEKAGIAKMVGTHIGGIGDKGSKSGFVGIASSIKIGELEFQDCPVEVLEKRSVVGEEGLIGANVFGDFLVELDFPKEKLRLSQLPKRPEEPVGPAALHTDEGNSGLADDDADMPAAPESDRFHDGFVAPEMKSFTRVYRFGHLVLVPTTVGKVPGKLFLMDTGALGNQITPAAAREVTKVHNDADMTVTGLSGSVDRVYSADKAILQFGRIRQENQDLLTFNFDSVSDDAGTEISGTLGFVLLHFLDIKIDYRDNLVDFEYKDPWERGSKKKE